MLSGRNFVLFSMLYMISCTALLGVQIDQSLSWAVNQNDSFSYEVERNSISLGSIRLQINETLPIIPDNVTEWNNLPVPSVMSIWDNGTEWKDYNWVRSFITSPLLPVGNWNLISELIETRSNLIYEISVDNFDASIWSYSFRKNLTNGEDFIYCSVSYSKATGMMTHLRIELFNVIRDEVTDELVLQTYNPTDPSFNMPYVAYLTYLGIIGVVLFLVVIYIRRNVR